MKNKGGDTVAGTEYLACYWISPKDDHVIYYIITRPRHRWFVGLTPLGQDNLTVSTPSEEIRIHNWPTVESSSCRLDYNDCPGNSPSLP